MFQRSRETRICYIVCCNAALSQMSDQLELLAENVFKTNTSLRYMVSVSASSNVWISIDETEFSTRSNLRYFVLGFRALKLLYNGRVYDKCDLSCLNY